MPDLFAAPHSFRRLPVAVSLVAGAALFLLFLAGCTGGSDEATKAALRGEGVSVEDVELSDTGGEQAYTPTLDGPLRVLSAAPGGQLQSMRDRQPISVTFSKPMAPLGEPPPLRDGALTVDPALPGSLRWEGTQTLVFMPADDLPPATELTATVHPVVRTADGESLGEAYSWSFQTPRPRVASATPADGSRYLDPGQEIEVSFTMPVDAQAVRSFVSFEGSRDWGSYSIEQGTDSSIVFTPDDLPSSGQSIQIQLEAGLPTKAGDLGMAEDEILSYRIRPLLQLSNVNQPGRYGRGDYAPDRGISLSFTTPVSFKALREAVSFEPEATWPDGIEAQDEQMDVSHALPVDLDPETQYTLTIDGLTDQFGQSLDRTTRRIRTGAYDPQLYVDRGVLFIEAEQYPVIRVRGVNIGSIQLGLDPIPADQIVPAIRTYSESYYGGSDDLPRRDRVELQRRWTPNMTRNEPGTVPLRLDSMLTEGGTGIVGMHLNWVPPGEDYDRDVQALATVTNLGVTGKFSPHSNLVFVTRLSDATPVRGASVEIRNEQNDVTWSGTTDSQGRVKTPGWAELDPGKDDPDQYAIVSYQGDVAYTSSRFDDGVEPYRFGLSYDWSPEPTTRTGSIFSDRGLYKNGETVHLKGIVREKSDADWRSITDSVRVVIRDPRDELVYDDAFKPSSLGSFDLSWTAPDDATQGRYDVTLARTDDESVYEDRSYRRGGFADGSFRIESFRRATFAVTTTTSSSDYVAGDFFEGSVSGRYLFGADMAGQPARYVLRKSQSSYEPPGFQGYRFGPTRGYSYRRDRSRSETLLRSEAPLDSASTVEARYQLSGNDTGAPAEITWTGTVTSPAEQTLSDQTTATLHPGLYYVGLKPETSFLSLASDSTLAVNVITTDPAGTPVAEKEVDVELVRIQWNSIREVGSDGRLRWRSERTEKVVRSKTVTTASRSAKRLNMLVQQPGYYRVQARSQDLRGNTIRTETYVYATGSGYVAWQRDNDDRIDLVPERTDYAPGETARLLVKNPFETATALVTVEREGVISSRVETLEGSAPQIEIPLDDEHIPNVYVSVILLNGRTAAPQTSSDPGAPGFRIGYTSLRVDPDQKHLRVSVDPGQQEYRPGEEVTVDLQLTDASGDGVEGEIAFAAADAGVLDLIGYSLPDPFQTFYGPRPLGVTTSETRANLVEQRNFGQKAEDAGGGGGSGEDQLRKDFRPLAHWAPAIRTDGDGRAQVTFKLPESLTTFRLMATALTADHSFGQGETDVVVTKPLVLQQAMPRFARLGDLFEAGVLISNRTGEAGTATVTAEADGLTLQSGASRSIRLADGATREVRFAWDALEAATATIRFRATLNDASDAFEWTLPVNRPRTKAVSATFASTDGRAEEDIRLPGNRIDGLGRFDVQLSSTALVGLDGAVEYLFDYPYGCLEQRTSRVRPLLIAQDVVDAFGLKPLGGDRNEAVREWLGGLDRYWTGSGFSLWKGSSYVNPYTTAYVVLALDEARDAGFELPRPLTGNAVSALENMVRNPSERPRYYSEDVWRDARALMLYALARHGRVLESELDRLASNPPTSAGGLGHLLRALVTADHGALSRFRTTIAERLRNMIRVEATQAYLDAPETDDYGWIFASDERATAHGLAALIENGAGEDFRQLAERMIRYLMNERTNGHWASTQDNAAAVDAFRAYFQTYETVDPDFRAEVSIAGRSILTSTFQGRRLRVAADTVSLSNVPSEQRFPAVVTKDGDGRAYYSMRVTTYTSDPVDARSQGLRVQRTLQRLAPSGEPTGKELATGNRTITLAPGDLVRVQLRVSTPTSRNYVVVDDALPAGLEPVNAAFATTDTGVLETAGAGSDRWWGSFNFNEMLDDRVLLFADYLREGTHTYTYVARATTAGTFVHPAAQAEMMYQPSTRGRNATGTLVVEPEPQQAKR